MPNQRQSTETRWFLAAVFLQQADVEDIVKMRPDRQLEDRCHG
jgi:hypothetical protein